MSETASGALFGGTSARGAVAAEVSDAAWVRALIDVEAALALVLGDPGLAARIRAVEVDPARLGRAAAESGSTVVPLAAWLREQAGPQAHAGATSQDIIDTAMMLVARRATENLLRDARAAADAAAGLADLHRSTPMMARTLLQRALPTSFGLKAATWMHGIDEATSGLARVRDSQLAVQMGGPVGHRDPSVAQAVSRELGLAEPLLPWSTTRNRVVRLAAALGELAGSLGKVARDVTLLAQDEIAEIREGGGPTRGGSSAMVHKRNPVAAISVLSCTKRVPPLVATLFAAMDQELERAAGAWQAEWETASTLLRLTGSAAAWSRDLLEHLQVDRSRLAAAAGADPDLGSAVALVERALRQRPSESSASNRDWERS